MKLPSSDTLFAVLVPLIFALAVGLATTIVGLKVDIAEIKSQISSIHEILNTQNQRKSTSNVQSQKETSQVLRHASRAPQVPSEKGSSEARQSKRTGENGQGQSPQTLIQQYAVRREKELHSGEE